MVPSSRSRKWSQTLMLLEFLGTWCAGSSGFVGSSGLSSSGLRVQKLFVGRGALGAANDWFSGSKCQESWLLPTSRSGSSCSRHRGSALRLRGGLRVDPVPGSFDVLVLGSGVSTGLPKIGCIVRPDPSGPICQVCQDALRTESKNRRNNVSILVRYFSPDGGIKHIMVDAGKTMRDACLRLLPKHEVHNLDALLLTHGHADAIFGLDDIRDFQEQGGIKLESAKPLPVYTNNQTFSDIKSRFSYLVPGAAGNPLDAEKRSTKATGRSGSRFVSKIEWNVVDSNVPFEIEGLEIQPLPVLHGGNYICLGFEFRSKSGGRFVYISDVSKIPEEVMAKLKAPDRRPDVLFLDALSRKTHFSHFGLDEAIATAKELNPQKCYLVGMTCSMGDHDAVNQYLRTECPDAEGLDIELAFDGLLLTHQVWDLSAQELKVR